MDHLSCVGLCILGSKNSECRGSEVCEEHLRTMWRKQEAWGRSGQSCFLEGSIWVGDGDFRTLLLGRDLKQEALARHWAGLGWSSQVLGECSVCFLFLLNIPRMT